MLDMLDALRTLRSYPVAVCLVSALIISSPTSAQDDKKSAGNLEGSWAIFVKTNRCCAEWKGSVSFKKDAEYDTKDGDVGYSGTAKYTVTDKEQGSSKDKQEKVVAEKEEKWVIRMLGSRFQLLAGGSVLNCNGGLSPDGKLVDTFSFISTPFGSCTLTRQ